MVQCSPFIVVQTPDSAQTLIQKPLQRFKSSCHCHMMGDAPSLRVDRGKICLSRKERSQNPHPFTHCRPVQRRFILCCSRFNVSSLIEEFNQKRLKASFACEVQSCFSLWTL